MRIEGQCNSPGLRKDRLEARSASFGIRNESAGTRNDWLEERNRVRETLVVLPESRSGVRRGVDYGSPNRDEGSNLRNSLGLSTFSDLAPLAQLARATDS